MKMQNGNVLHAGNGGNEYALYTKILGELGIEKKGDEPITDYELRQIFVRMQEDLLNGS